MKNAQIKAILGMAVVGITYSLGMLSAQIDVLPYRALVRLEYAALKKPLSGSGEFDQRVGLFNPNAPGATVVMLGDSLTNYADWNFILKRTDIINYGVPGDISSGLLQRVTDANIKGKTVFVMIGANDLSHKLPVEYIADNIQKSIAILAPHNRVYLQSTLLTRKPILNEGVRRLDEAEARICAAYANCTLIDLNPVISPSGVLGGDASLDDVHVNAASYNKWAATISPYMKKF